MPKINLLEKQVAELIAAGEVVERPASVIKEIIENSIDAGSTSVTVEIQHGGILYMRVTDNGYGISHDDVPLAFLRHATSKIKLGSDLDSIATLGFRGEALAAISSVARVELFTKTAEDQFGTHYIIEGGSELLFDEAGCPDGTTIIIRDIFYNTPARMKFLKKDVTEANTISAVIDRIALSHPEVAFKLIKDGKQILSTSGDGKLTSAIYSVLGRDFSQSLIPVDYSFERLTVTGLTCKPIFCKQTRNGQYTFLNGRLVRSGTIVAACEQAYKNSAMIGKFPGFVLNISVPFDTVDVNVHPAKTEVRFSDEKRIFDLVYGAIKNALAKGDTRPEVNIKPKAINPFQTLTTEQYRQQTIHNESSEKTIAEKTYNINNGLHKSDFKPTVLRNDNNPFLIKVDKADVAPIIEQANKVRANVSKNVDIFPDEAPLKTIAADDITVKIQEDKPVMEAEAAERLPIRLIGEAFNTYIIVEMGNSVYMIDKHAAHERILFNKLKSEQKTEVQALLTPVSVSLAKEDYGIIISNLDLILKSGFEIEDFGSGNVIVRAVPASLVSEDITLLVSSVAQSLYGCGNVQIEKLDNLFHTVACKAAIKAGFITDKKELLSLAEKVLNSKEIMYCPHGRPVAFEIKKYELEKQFGRIQ